jgi:hypothetical protein
MQYVSFATYHVSLYTINAHIKVHMPPEHTEAYNYTPVFRLLHKVISQNMEKVKLRRCQRENHG